jgi:putative phosphoesterase
VPDPTLARDRLRPPDVPAARVTACLGLIADTHMGDRGRELPAALFDQFRGVDLILHAGDVGLLTTLTQLSALAPVVAVHGNDERFEETPRELPYQQLVGVAGHRIVLTHGHNPDLSQEAEARRDDRWEPKLARRAAFGHRAGARIVVYGHTHVPTHVEYDGVWLINPGATASGGLDTRMRHHTVALLYLRDDGVPFSVHVDLDHPERPFAPWSDWAAGFKAARDAFEASILAPELAEDYFLLRGLVTTLDRPVLEAVRAAVRTVAYRCWDGHQSEITRAELVAALKQSPTLPEEVRRQALDLLTARQRKGSTTSHSTPQAATDPI